MNYNFGERPEAGGRVSAGETATIGFWQNRNGQALIRSLPVFQNPDGSTTSVANWLAATFSNIYGAHAGANNLFGMSNGDVANLYTSLFKRTTKTGLGGPPKLDAQVMATALAVYVTNEDLAGMTAAGYGFLVTQNGVGVATFDVGSQNRDAFGLSASDSTVLTVLDALLATNRLTNGGILYDLNSDGSISMYEQVLRTMANVVYSAINEGGQI